MTVVTAPFVFVLALALVRSATWADLYRSLPFVFLLMIFGFLLLLPAVLLYWVVFLVLRQRPMEMRLKKLLLSVVGIIAVWLIYYFFDRRFFHEGGFGVYSWPLSYSLVLATAGAYFGLPAEAPAGTGAKHQQK